MKVHDIRAFFGRPGSSKGGHEDQTVEVPSRLKKGSSKKSKKDDRLDVSVTDDGSDIEDPLPKAVKNREEKKNGKGGKKKVKPIVEDDDSDVEDPLPKSSRGKGKDKDEKTSDKKRKARVLSESDEDDDFKSKGKSSKEKPALKLAKVEKVEVKKEEKKLVNPAEFFSSAPVKRQTKASAEPEKRTSPEKKKHISPKKEEQPVPEVTTKKSSSSVKSPQKSKPHNGSEESSPHRPLPKNLAEPKRLKLETPTPEKKIKEEKPKPSSTKLQKTPEKQEKVFKVPTPVTAEKSKSRTKASKQSAHIDEDDEEEDDFDPKKKASKPKATKEPAKKKASKKKTDGSASETDEEKDKRKQNYMKFMAKQNLKPRNLGSKMIPTGAPGCLDGLAFVLSGVLDSLEREDCEALIKKYGGRVTGSVSGKTSYLIVGEEAGASKTNKANQLKVPIINEDHLLEMIRKSNPNGVESQDSGLAYSEEFMDSEQIDYDADRSLFSTPAPEKKGSKRTSPEKPGPSKVTKEESPKKKIKVEGENIKMEVDKKNEETASTSTSTPRVIGEAEPMWVDKYRPKSLKAVVGQGGDKSNAKKLVEWLENWFKHHGKANDKVKAAWPGLRDPKGETFKAALLSGPPGIGKTTTAHLAVKECGYDYYELNASDTRNKRGLHENVADALSNKTLVFGKSNEEMTRKHVLIMDEVDGMSGNEDRGGVQELIALIKKSRVPVICICNDRNHTKIRSLSNYCFDLRFYKPSFEQLRGFISSICFREKIKLPQEKVQQLIISTDNDVRQILHQLELFKEGKGEQAFNPRKDLRFGPWDVIRKVFLKLEHDKLSIHDKIGLFFQDYNIGPLFVQENYPKWIPARANGNRYKHMDILARTASSLADGDICDNQIRRSQNWSLLPVHAVMSSYIPGEFMVSNTMGQVEFPQWLGKNSTKGKRQRLLQSLHTHLHLHVSGSLEALNMDYLPYLRRSIVNPLVEGNVEEAATVMENYTLLRDDVESISELSIWPGTKDPMEKVATQTKSAFTRKVNKEILPYSIAKSVKGKGRGGGAANPEDELEALLEEGEGEAEQEEEEDDSIEKDGMVKMKTRKASASKSKTSSSSKGGKKAKKTEDDDDFDDEEDYGCSSKSSKPSKSKSTAKPRKR